MLIRCWLINLIIEFNCSIHLLLTVLTTFFGVYSQLTNLNLNLCGSSLVDFSIHIIQDAQQSCFGGMVLLVCRLLFTEIIRLCNVLTKTRQSQPFDDFWNCIQIWDRAITSWIGAVQSFSFEKRRDLNLFERMWKTAFVERHVCKPCD